MLIYTFFFFRPASPLSQKDVMAAPTGNPSMTSMDGSSPTGTRSESGKNK